ncbi:MAG TPA: hypothetical protein DCR93_03740 [Cytophagales bacterium]|nr:hypothetical protein [Cytophagales bacterium]HAP58649.1 hypothetical protein [Cytophagales bacterium]
MKSAMLNKKIRVSLYGVLVEKEKVLLVRTKLPTGSVINFPGGALEWDEHPLEGLKREFYEETGLKVKTTALLFASEKKHFFPNRPENHCYCVYYSVESSDASSIQIIDEEEILDCFWYPVSDLPHPEMSGPEFEFCERLGKSVFL